MSPTVPPISTSRKSRPSVSASTNSLIMSVTCGNHLHGAAQIAALALLLDHLAVDAPRGDIVGLARRDAGEALIMAQIQIGLRAVVGDIDFAMLERAHRARIDIQIGIEFAQTDFVAARLKQRAKGGGRQTFSEGRDHAAGDED